MQKPEVQTNCLKWIESQIIKFESLRVEPAPRNKWQRPAAAEKESKKRKSLEWKQWNKCEIDTQPCWIQLSSDCWSCQRSCMAFGSIWRSPTMPVTKEKVSRRRHFHVYARFWQARGAMRHILTQNWVIRRCCSMPANADSSHFSFTVHIRQECAPGETEFIAAFHVSSIAHRALVTHEDSSPQIDNRFSVDGLKGHFLVPFVVLQQLSRRFVSAVDSSCSNFLLSDLKKWNSTRSLRVGRSERIDEWSMAKRIENDGIPCRKKRKLWNRRWKRAMRVEKLGWLNEKCKTKFCYFPSSPPIVFRLLSVSRFAEPALPIIIAQEFEKSQPQWREKERAARWRWKAKGNWTGFRIERARNFFLAIIRLFLLRVSRSQIDEECCLNSWIAVDQVSVAEFLIIAQNSMSRIGT